MFINLILLVKADINKKGNYVKIKLVVLLLGIIFAIASKNWLFGIVGTALNAVILVFVYFLSLAKGIGG
ncbi:hypothetical protein [Bacillus wiedmannii]|uniref:hypothetical protein n=1 Tax=Bacillus wiedmannii TaxID=1890302 RepID=UPI00272F2888|nr:hypothetical protein [Bacillus wiedmannii]